ncbi:translation initiation factor IF-2 subunit beta [Haloglomus litoreum]|uniref:translation initiation factor IF-2 subunit beta n=1 Tax=Haloglomus litoreum TaxID=3034026 RepID=UPI0023E837E9|nr:translation initiation factor IF-2 subunit beta [Haloglomus sp. DT116]
MDYESSLTRALDALPERSAEASRLSVPDPEAQADGAFTRFTNLDAVADALNREVDHVHSFVQRALATAGQLSEGVGRYNGRFDGTDFDAAISDYVEEYVRCSECGLPDTRLVTENGTQMLRCDACGAFRPVSKRRSTSQQQADAVEKGGRYTVEITDTGRKGDGVAKRGGYTIFVPGTQEGDVVDVYIENVSGQLAFARTE